MKGNLPLAANRNDKQDHMSVLIHYMELISSQMKIAENSSCFCLLVNAHLAEMERGCKSGYRIHHKIEIRMVLCVVIKNDPESVL